MSFRKKHPSKCVTKFCRRLKRKKGAKLCSTCSMRRWRAANTVKAKLAILRDRAARKHVSFDLDADWLTEFLKINHYDSTIHHIDRICVNEGYVKRNLQVLTVGENIAKGNRERHGYAWRDREATVPF